MREEGYRERPYVDPNWQQVNIGYAKSFRFLTPAEKKAAFAIPNAAARTKYIMGLLTPAERNMRISEPAARTELWKNYLDQRKRVTAWLQQEGFRVKNPRLLDQLAMLAYASKFDNFQKFASTRQALDSKDENKLSYLASRFGRTATGATPAVRRVLAARRDAERNYFLGNDLPAKKDVVIKPTDVAIPAVEDPNVSGLARFKIASAQFPQDPEDVKMSNELVLGEEGRRKANELVWQMMLGHEGEPPENFDAREWAEGVMRGEDDQAPKPVDWSGIIPTMRGSTPRTMGELISGATPPKDSSSP